VQFGALVAPLAGRRRWRSSSVDYGELSPRRREAGFVTDRVDVGHRAAHRISVRPRGDPSAAALAAPLRRWPIRPPPRRDVPARETLVEVTTGRSMVRLVEAGQRDRSKHRDAQVPCELRHRQRRQHAPRSPVSRSGVSAPATATRARLQSRD
jgi:hypothetical protein